MVNLDTQRDFTTLNHRFHFHFQFHLLNTSFVLGFVNPKNLISFILKVKLIVRFPLLGPILNQLEDFYYSF